VPWCESCNRFYTPSTLTSEGDCPSGHQVSVPPQGLSQALTDDTPAGSEPTPLRVPWHFWLLVAALVIYLGWRLVQGVVWLIN
jgi:hypothetical protein